MTYDAVWWRRVLDVLARSGHERAMFEAEPTWWIAGTQRDAYFIEKEQHRGGLRAMISSVAVGDQRAGVSLVIVSSFEEMRTYVKTGHIEWPRWRARLEDAPVLHLDDDVVVLPALLNNLDGVHRVMPREIMTRTSRSAVDQLVDVLRVSLSIATMTE